MFVDSPRVKNTRFMQKARFGLLCFSANRNQSDWDICECDHINIGHGIVGSITISCVYHQYDPPSASKGEAVRSLLLPGPQGGGGTGHHCTVVALTVATLFIMFFQFARRYVGKRDVGLVLGPMFNNGVFSEFGLNEVLAGASNQSQEFEVVDSIVVKIYWSHVMIGVSLPNALFQDELLQPSQICKNNSCQYLWQFALNCAPVRP